MQQSLELQANKVRLTDTQTGASHTGAISMRLGILIVLHLGINLFPQVMEYMGKAIYWNGHT